MLPQLPMSAVMFATPSICGGDHLPVLYLNAMHIIITVFIIIIYFDDDVFSIKI